MYPLWDTIIAAVTTEWTTAQLHTWEVQHRPYLESPPDHLWPADPHTLSPSNNSARASVEPVYLPLQLECTTFDEVEGGWAHAAASTVVSSQPEEPPENVLVSSPLKEPPENVRARPQTAESPETVLASPQAVALVEPAQVAPLPQEQLQPVYVEKLSGALRRDLDEESLLRACRCPLVNCSAMHSLF